MQLFRAEAVLPLKTDASVFESAKSMVGDGHTVGVASQILEYALRFAEGRLDVNQRSSLHNSRWK